MKRFFVVVFAVFTGYVTFAQFINLEFESFDSEKGLSQNHVYAIVQDKKGFVWAGTDDGLNRFDGHEFRIYKYESDNPNSIVDNSIRSLMADDSSVWIGTGDGLCRYFTDTEYIQRFKIDVNDSLSLRGQHVNVIKKDKNGNIWIGYLGDGIDVILSGNKGILNYSIHANDNRRLTNNLVTSIEFMPDGDVLVGTLGGIEVLDPTLSVMDKETAKTKYPWKNEIDRSVKHLLVASGDKTLWIGTELKGLYRVDLVDKKVKHFTAANGKPAVDYVLTIHEDNGGNIWIGAEVVYLFDKTLDLPLPYHEYGMQGNIEIKNPIYAIFEDRDGNIWLGTYRIGLLKYNSGSTNVLHYYSTLGQKGVRNEIFCFIQDDDGQVWVGTGEAGLFALRKDLKGFIQAPLTERFDSKSVKCMYKGPSGYLWLGSWNKGLMKYHPKRNTLETFHPDNGNFGSRHVWDIRGDGNGNLWLGTLRDGLCHFNTKTNAYFYYKNVPDDSTSLANDDIMCLLLDSEKTLWIGTSYGLSILRRGSKEFININKGDKLTSNLIFCLLEDNTGKVWIGTNGGGLIIFDKQLNRLAVLDERQGLPSSTITAIRQDDRNNIWVSTYKGIAKINGQTLTLEEVPQLTGLRGKEFIPNSSFKSSDGRLYFGGFNGFNLFHPDSLQLNPINEKVVFTSLKIQNNEVAPGRDYRGRKILRRSITETDELQLSFRDQSVTISFALLTYNWQRSLYYAYMLENLHTEWQYTTADRRFVHYTNLTPGDYELKVKASFDGKNWPAESASLRISVAPPWWDTAWFKAMAFLLFIFVMYTAYRVRVRYLRNQKVRLETLVEKGTEEIQKLLSEVGDKNHELQIINEQLKIQRDDLEDRGLELERAQAKLKVINSNLEDLVSKRTKKLNTTLRELETFLYRASHDLRGPISSILGLIKVSGMENSADPINKTYTDFLEKTTIKLERTLQKLTQKYTIQKSKLTSEIISKSLLLKLLEEAISNVPGFRPNDFELKIAEHTSFVTDRAMLNILLVNLLENAFFFSERSANKKVMMQITQEDGNTIILVTDHGPGIKHEVRDKIFGMFYRGNELSTGNGLGLYLVKSALQRIKGRISVETEVGMYCSFIVTLPDLVETPVASVGSLKS